MAQYGYNKLAVKGDIGVTRPLYISIIHIQIIIHDRSFNKMQRLHLFY